MIGKLLPLCLLSAAQLAAQNVGIGLLNAIRGKLEVQGTGNTVAIFGGDGQGISIQRSQPAIGFNQYYNGVNSYYIGTGYAAVQWLEVATGNMYFDMFGHGSANAPYTSILRSMTVSRTGNAGIGTAPLAYARVAVGRGTGSWGTAVFRGSVWASHINYSTAENTYIRGGKAGSYVYINDIPGGEVLMGNPTATATSLVKVGINSSDPGYALEVRQASNLGMIMIANSNFANWHFKVGPALAPGSYQLLYFNESGNAIGAFHPQTGAYAALSDVRVKKDISPLPDVGARLQKLQPVQYQVNAAQADSEVQSGFVAQDLMGIFPSLVTHQKEGVPGQEIEDMYLLNYDGMAVYAVKLIQEQQRKIEALKKKLESLKKAKENRPLP